MTDDTEDQTEDLEVMTFPFDLTRVVEELAAPNQPGGATDRCRCARCDHLLLMAFLRDMAAYYHESPDGETNSDMTVVYLVIDAVARWIYAGYMDHEDVEQMIKAGIDKQVRQAKRHHVAKTGHEPRMN